MKLENIAIHELKDDFEGVQYTHTHKNYMYFTDDNGTNIRGEVFFSEYLGKHGISLEQYNKGWREITTLHV
jgi:hypothetical protein